MNLHKKKNLLSYLPIILTLVFYFAGAAMIKKADVEHLKKKGLATQEEYTYYDSEGEEHEGETLIEVHGLGTVLTYQNIYHASVILILPAIIIGTIVFGKGIDEIKCAVFANCIIGLFLIYLTTKEQILSTALFWLGIIAATFIDNSPTQERSHSHH